MKPRRWTVLVVPHTTDSPRRFEVGERGVRLARVSIGLAGMVLFAALLVLFSPWATPAARWIAYENVRLEREIAQLDAAVARLADSMDVLAAREAEFRQLAGITSVDSALNAQLVDGTPNGAAPQIGFAGMDDRRRPFAAFLGNRPNRPDVDALIDRASELSSAFAAVSDSMVVRIEHLRNTPSIMPTRGWLTGAFSRARMHPILHEMRPHDGIDVSAPMGTPIIAPAAGTVTKVGREGGYGNIVEIDHGNGIVTRYAHCQRIIVRAGMRVERGQMIATVGNTGLSVGPHLHYEIHVDGRPVDPMTYVIPGGGP